VENASRKFLVKTKVAIITDQKNLQSAKVVETSLVMPLAANKYVNQQKIIADHV